MDKLPNELLAFVLTGQTKRDLKALRLVNRTLAAAVTPELFNSVSAWISVRSLQNLTNLSEHPELSPLVRKLTISPLRIVFLPGNPYSQLKECIKETLELKHSYLNAYELGVTKFLAAHGSYIEEQDLLSERSLDVKILSRILDKFMHLGELAVNYFDNVTGAKELNEAFGCTGLFNFPELLTRNCEYTLPVIIRAMAFSKAKIRVFKLIGERDRDCTHSNDLGHAGCMAQYPFPSKCHIPSSARPTVRQRFSSHAMITPQALYQSFVGCDKWNLNHALRRVRRLQIRPGHSEDNEHYGSIEEMSFSLRRLIESTTKLKLLFLDAMCPLDELEAPSMVDVFSSHHLQHLQMLSLRRYETTQSYLIKVMKKHQATLIMIFFSYMSVTDSDWSKALAALRSLEFPRLENFILYCCEQDICGDVEVAPYLIHKTDQDPFAEKRRSQKEDVTETSEEDPD